MNENAERSKAVKSIVLDGNYRYAMISESYFSWGAKGISTTIENDENSNMEKTTSAKYETHNVLGKKEVGHISLRYWESDCNCCSPQWMVELTSTTSNTFVFELSEGKARLLYLELYQWAYGTLPHISAMADDIDLSLLN